MDKRQLLPDETFRWSRLIVRGMLREPKLDFVSRAMGKRDSAAGRSASEHAAAEARRERDAAMAAEENART